jgi:hypothetical protein
MFKLWKSIIFIVVFIYSLSSSSLYGYDGLLFKPLTANVFEPRVGSFYEFGAKKLRLDIGTSQDLWVNKFKTFSVGADFFTFTRLRTAGDFKFPVETSDYFFGVNMAYIPRFMPSDESGKWFPKSIRIRIAHISSHLVDGMSDNSVFEQHPFVYSREFFDFIAAYNIYFFRPYLGFTYIFHKIPDSINNSYPETGVDFDYNLTDFLSLTGGYDFKLFWFNNKENGVNQAQLGIKLNLDSPISLFVGGWFYNGLSMHGEFYNQRDNYFGLGFQLMYNKSLSPPPFPILDIEHPSGSPYQR